MPQAVSAPAAYSFFDYSHWLKVRAERARLGISPHPERRQVPDHPLVNRTLVETSTGKAYKVLSVRRDWYHGWFLVATLERDGSHGTCVVGNLSCRSDEILSQLEFFQSRFTTAQ